MSADKHPAEVLAERLDRVEVTNRSDAQAVADAADMLRRIPALEAERDRHLAEHAQCMADMDGEIDRLRAEVEALRADADRYRWLHDQYLVRHGLLKAMNCQPAKGEPCGDWWLLWPPYGIDRRYGPVGYAKTEEGAIDAARNNTAA